MESNHWIKDWFSNNMYIICMFLCISHINHGTDGSISLDMMPLPALDKHVAKVYSFIGQWMPERLYIPVSSGMLICSWNLSVGTNRTISCISSLSFNTFISVPNHTLCENAFNINKHRTAVRIGISNAFYECTKSQMSCERWLAYWETFSMAMPGRMRSDFPEWNANAGSSLP